MQGEAEYFTYPRGPPLRTRRSRSKPDIKTAAPLFNGPNTFSEGADILTRIILEETAKGRTFWHETILKHQFTSVTSSHTKLVELLMCREPGPAFLNNERGNTFRAFSRFSLRVDNERRSDGSVGYPVSSPKSQDETGFGGFEAGLPELVPVELVPSINFIRP